LGGDNESRKGKDLMKGRFWDNFGIAATILGFIVDTLAVIALISSGVEPRIPFIDYPLGTEAKLTIIALALFTYLGFLRKYWVRERGLQRTDSKYFSYFVTEVFLEFKRPFLFIPVILLIGLTFTVLTPEIGGGNSCVSIGFVLLLAYSALAISEHSASDDEARVYVFTNQSFYREFMPRIHEHIETKGYAISLELADMYSIRNDMIRWVLYRYFNDYERKENLAIFTYNVKRRRWVLPQSVGILAKKTLLNTRPWLKDLEELKKGIEFEDR
jgi:hypothetical protein